MSDAGLCRDWAALARHPEVRALVGAAVAEDTGRRDVTTEVVLPEGLWAKGKVVAQAQFVAAGVWLASLVFELVDPSVHAVTRAAEGEEVAGGRELVTISGPAACLLRGERTLLNFLQHLSGVATMARAFVEAVAGTGVLITDTRKTTPGLRLLEKYASGIGGAVNHRCGLDDGILIKNNHIALAGGVSHAVRTARARAPWGMKIEVECSTRDEVEAALSAGADLLLLDNLTPAGAREMVSFIGGRAKVEISGGVTLDNVRDYALAKPDRISVGAITHSAPAVPIHMTVEPADAPGRKA